MVFLPRALLLVLVLLNIREVPKNMPLGTESMPSWFGPNHSRLIMLRTNGSAVVFLHRSELEECVTQQADIVVKVPTGQHWRIEKVFNLKKKSELSFRYGTLQHERI